MNKIASLIVICAIVVGIGIILYGDRSRTVTPENTRTELNNVEIRDGIQYVTITARAGYTPQTSHAKAGIPTKLIVRTNGTYDCSLALIIHSLKYQKILEQTGEEVIDLGIPAPGVPLQGVCSMGMYNFSINFDN